MLPPRQRPSRFGLQMLNGINSMQIPPDSGQRQFDDLPKPARRSSQEVPDPVGAAQIKVGVVLPGDADAAEDLNAVLRIGFCRLTPVAAAMAAAIDSWSPSAETATAASAPPPTPARRSSISAQMCLIAESLPGSVCRIAHVPWRIRSPSPDTSERRRPPGGHQCRREVAESAHRDRNVSTGTDSSVTRASGREKSVAASGSTGNPAAPESTSTTRSAAGSSSTLPGTAPRT